MSRSIDSPECAHHWPLLHPDPCLRCEVAKAQRFEAPIKREAFTEQHHFIIEAAMQLGFHPIDDDVSVFQVTDEDIVEFARRIAGAAIDQATTEEREEHKKRAMLGRLGSRVGCCDSGPQGDQGRRGDSGPQGKRGV